MKHRFWRCCLGACLCAGLMACETAPQKLDGVPAKVQASGAPAEAQVIAEPVKPVDLTAVKEQALADALGVYADGRFDDAVERLTPLVGVSELPLSSQVKVLKFIAFSHCAMGRPKPCRQHFDLALEQDPTFQLTEAEKGHPVWGKEFNRARVAARNKRPVSKSP